MKRKGFTLIELLVVIAIIAILAAILFPVFARARENARRASCMSNQKQIALGIFQYSQDYDEKYPRPYVINYTLGGNYVWAYNIQPYVKSTQIFNCPSYSAVTYNGETWPPGEDLPIGMSYYFEPVGTNLGLSLSSVAKPAETVMIGDGHLASFRIKPDGYSLDGGSRLVDYRHLETANIGFADGHVKSMKKAQLQKTDTIEDGQLLTGDNQWVLWNLY